LIGSNGKNTLGHKPRQTGALTMQERRNPMYTFTSERDLVRFFSQTLGRREVLAILEQVKADFVGRKGVPEEEQHLQMLKKCEVALVRQVHARTVAQAASRSGS
jgi:hypothetical protein